MKTIKQWENELLAGSLDEQIKKLLVIAKNKALPSQTKDRFSKVLTNFRQEFGVDENHDVAFFSAPGRTELLGNHTDHQRGHVVAAAVNLDAWAAVSPNQENAIRFKSEGWDALSVNLDKLEPIEEEKETTSALVRGVAAAFVQKGYPAQGLDIYCQSNVLPGSGLSSSAAIELLLAVILNHFWAEDQENPITLAKMGQYAENIFFGKPSGLMDQMASAVGSAVHIDFTNSKDIKIESFDLNLEKEGYALCIIDSGADHTDLTEDYAAIPNEMKNVARFFNKEVLSQVSEEEFMQHIKEVRAGLGDRSVARAIHFFQENKRVLETVDKFKTHDFSGFLHAVNQSGYSSWTQLQNVWVPGSIKHQEVGIALSVVGQILAGQGAYRVHGGGFAGTIQAFVPLDIVQDFKADIEKILGDDTCHIVQIRNIGGYVFE